MARRRYKRRTPLSTQLTRLLLVAIVGAVGFAFYSKWRVETTVAETLDQWAKQLSPVGELRYLDVTAGLDGALVISDLAFYPGNDVDIPPQITEKITIQFPDFLALTGIRPRGLPLNLTMVIDGARLDAGMGGRILSGNPFEAMACGDVTEFTTLDLQAMGFPYPRATLRLGYRVEGADSLAIEMAQRTGDFADVNVQLGLQIPGVQRALAERRLPADAGTLAIRNLSLALDAAEFNQARNNYCAEQLDIAPDDAIAANVEAVVNLIQDHGWTPDPTLVDRYEAFLSGAGQLTLKADPETPVTPDSFLDMAPPLLVQRFNLTMAVADQPAVPFALSAYAPPRDEEETTDGQPVRRRGQWVDVPYQELDQFLNRSVQIHTNELRRYDGQLVGVDENEVRISTRIPGGTAVVPIARSRIDELKVYVRGRDRPRDPDQVEEGGAG